MLIKKNILKLPGQIWKCTLILNCNYTVFVGHLVLVGVLLVDCFYSLKKVPALSQSSPVLSVAMYQCELQPRLLRQRHQTHSVG